MTSGIPYTIIRSTQFMEFLGAIAASSADGNMVRISPGLFQPIAADDVDITRLGRQGRYVVPAEATIYRALSRYGLGTPRFRASRKPQGK
jgi:hypothetical protein